MPTLKFIGVQSFRFEPPYLYIRCQILPYMLGNMRLDLKKVFLKLLTCMPFVFFRDRSYVKIFFRPLINHSKLHVIKKLEKTTCSVIIIVTVILIGHLGATHMIHHWMTALYHQTNYAS